MAAVGSLRVYDEQKAIPSADGFVSVVTGPRFGSRAYGQRGDAAVVWSPERGWLCEEHTAQPCEHTEGLNAPGLVK